MIIDDDFQVRKVMTMKKCIQDISKVELHCHLDGSVSSGLIKQLAAEQQIPLIEDNLIVSEACESLDEYLQCFDEILKVLQTTDSLKRAVVDVVNQADRDNVKYIEIRFAPMLHMEKGLGLPEIFEAVEAGVETAVASTGIKVNLLVCAMRQQDATVNTVLFDYLQQRNSQFVCGIDFAGPEAPFPPNTIETQIEYGVNKGFNLTLHAGECGCMHNVMESIRLGAKRIGHGVAINQDEVALQEVKAQNILLEMCPKSNIQTKAIQDLSDLNLPYLLQEEIPFLINTDNRTVTQTSLNEEYQLLLEHHLITLDQIETINQNAINFAFLPENERQHIKSKLMS